MKEILNQVFDDDFDLLEIDRSVDEHKASKFIDSIKDLNKRKTAQQIIDNTIYIHFNEFKNKLIDVVNQLPDKFNVYFGFNSVNDKKITSKIGSEHWCIALVWDYIKNKCVDVITDAKDISNDFPIVIIDDCIYSGIAMCSRVDNLSYDYKIIFNKPLINEIICAVPYCVEGNFKTLCFELGAIVIVGQYIKPLKSILNNYNYEQMYEYFGCESETCTPLYFDHKIANNFGSINNIYEKIIKQQPSREMIEKVKNNLHEHYF